MAFFKILILFGFVSLARSREIFIAIIESGTNLQSTPNETLQLNWNIYTNWLRELESLKHDLNSIIAVFPEYGLSAGKIDPAYSIDLKTLYYLNNGTFSQIAKLDLDPLIFQMANVSMTLKIGMLVHLLERRQVGKAMKYFSTALLFSERGDLAGIYHQRNVKHSLLSSGLSDLDFQLNRPKLNVGILIDADVFIPTKNEAKVDLVLAPFGSTIEANEAKVVFSGFAIRNNVSVFAAGLNPKEENYKKLIYKIDEVQSTPKSSMLIKQRRIVNDQYLAAAIFFEEHVLTLGNFTQSNSSFVENLNLETLTKDRGTFCNVALPMDDQFSVKFGHDFKRKICFVEQRKRPTKEAKCWNSTIAISMDGDATETWPLISNVQVYNGFQDLRVQFRNNSWVATGPICNFGVVKFENRNTFDFFNSIAMNVENYSSFWTQKLIVEYNRALKRKWVEEKFPLLLTPDEPITEISKVKPTVESDNWQQIKPCDDCVNLLDSLDNSADDDWLDNSAGDDWLDNSAAHQSSFLFSSVIFFILLNKLIC